MNTFNLLVHRWCLRHKGRKKKGKTKERMEKWDEVKGLQNRIGVKFK